MGGSSAYIDHADAIGSTTMETDPAGGVQWDMTHYPWGQVWQQGGTRQSGVYANLDWQVNDPLQPSATREYSPVLGRWMTPDPLGQAAANPANPQSWNLYAYVMNNPTTFADPLGLLGPNDCNPNATCITVNGGAPPQISPIVELLMDENINIPNSQLPPQLPLTKFPNPWELLNPGQNNSTKTDACTEAILSAVNNYADTSFTGADVVQPPGPFTNGNTRNLIIRGNGLSASQFNSIQTGRYPLNWWSYLIGYGPTFHVTGQTYFDPAPAVFANSNIGGATSVLFTAHIDPSFAYTPIGAALHGLDVLLTKLGLTHHNPCP